MRILAVILNITLLGIGVLRLLALQNLIMSGRWDSSAPLLCGILVGIPVITLIALNKPPTLRSLAIIGNVLLFGIGYLAGATMKLEPDDSKTFAVVLISSLIATPIVSILVLFRTCKSKQTIDALKKPDPADSGERSKP